MDIKIILILVFPLFLQCNPVTKEGNANAGNIICQPEDKKILEEMLALFAEQKEGPVAGFMIKAGIFLKNTPYADHTLEHEPEELVINLREMDCTTFVENCLAVARTVKSKKPGFEQFAKELQNIRYRNGKIDGYPSRLHYFSDWIFTNEQKHLVKDVSGKIAETPYPLQLNFMSTHPDSYRQLRDSAFIQAIAETEKKITARIMYYIPKTKLAGYEDELCDGDIVGITTDIQGLDVSHTALLIRQNGRIHILHASSSARKVVVSDETLEDYLNNNKRSTGIMVARPL